MERYRQSDTELVSHYKNGNEEAFAELLNRHQSRVYSTIYFIVKDKFLAEDIMQDVYMKVIRHIKNGKYNEQGKFLPWILRIANNLAIDNYRRNKRYPEITFEDGTSLEDVFSSTEMSYEDQQIRKEMKHRLRNMISRLPFNQRQVLIMRHFIGMSFQEIAEKTGVSINTALGRMRYALINLRKEMEQNKIAYDKNFYPE